ncbi:MAG: hypothetical protein HZA30_05290 [Candidatus Omnitrophica bacterium]|nr:hypothetical protein [Candidatus Omnitrophota bacterium]
MRELRIFSIVLVLLISGISVAIAEPDAAMEAKIEALQAQIKAMHEDHEKQMAALQSQFDVMKEQLIAQKDALVVKESAKPAPIGHSAKSLWDRSFQSGSFRLRDAVGLSDESKLNIAGELNLRYRQDLNENVNTDQGFQFYEIELFLDAAVNDYTSIFVEYPISHKNYLNPGNAWVDFHFPGELAASEYTGLMIGNFSPRFGYLNYDDNQSWIYGGRTTTNTTLIRGRSIDEQTIRNRQIGASLPVRIPLNDYGWFLVEGGVNNGDGPIEFSGGSDNDKRVDTSGRIQYTLPNDWGLAGVGFWHSPRTAGATANTAGTRWGGAGTQHVREIDRYIAYAKFPNVQQATLPDLSLGGKPFMVYGEFLWGTAHASQVKEFTTDQNFLGWYVETNFNILRDKLVGIFRVDYFDPGTSINDNSSWAFTPALKWNIWNNLWLTSEYEHYEGDKNATGKDDDRVAFEMAVWF